MYNKYYFKKEILVETSGNVSNRIFHLTTKIFCIEIVLVKLLHKKC